MPTTLLQVPRRTFGRLRGVPQVSRHLLWRLRESRKSPGICFGVCGESRKCFGELVGRYNMLSMTFSMNKGISFFRRTHVCLPSAEAFCCRPNYAAYSGHCAKPIECLFEAAQASTEAGNNEVGSVSVPGQTLLAAVATPIAAKRARPIFAPMIFDS